MCVCVCVCMPKWLLVPDPYAMAALHKFSFAFRI